MKTSRKKVRSDFERTTIFLHKSLGNTLYRTNPLVVIPQDFQGLLLPKNSSSDYDKRSQNSSIFKKCSKLFAQSARGRLRTGDLWR